MKSNDSTKFTGALQPHNGKVPEQPKPVGPGEYPGACLSSIGKQNLSRHKSQVTYSFGLPENRSRNRTRGDPLERQIKYTSSLPGPGQYMGALTPSVGPQVDSRRPASARFSFGTASRDAGSPLRNYATRPHLSKNGDTAPTRPGAGPGAYKPLEGLGTQVLSPRRTAASYSFGPSAGASWKSLRFRDKKRDSSLPGPGQYKRNDGAIGPQIYTRTRTQPAFGFGTGRRYPRPKTSLPGYRPNPGPGQYSLGGSFGEQVFSKFRTVGASKFGSSQRVDVAAATKNAPGPGRYDGRIESFGTTMLKKNAPSFGFGTTRRMRYNAVVMK